MFDFSRLVDFVQKLSSQKQDRKQLRRFYVERLEDRTVPAILSEEGVLRIQGEIGDDADDLIVIMRQQSGQVSIDNDTIFDALNQETLSSISAGRVVRIEIESFGGSDMIDLDSAAVTGQEPIRIPASILTHNGNDLIKAVAGYHTVDAGRGSDTIHYTLDFAGMLSNNNSTWLNYTGADFDATGWTDTVHLKADLSTIGSILTPYLGKLKATTRDLKQVADLLDTPVPIISHFKDTTFGDLIERHGGGAYRQFAEVVQAIHELPLGSSELQGFVDLGAVDIREFQAGLDLTVFNPPQLPDLGFFDELDEAAVRLPVLQDNLQALKMLLPSDLAGSPNIDLFEMQVPGLEAHFDYEQYYPIFYGISVEVFAEISLKANLAVGYDTAGLRSGRLLDGVYIAYAKNQANDMLPIVEISGSLGAGVVAGIPKLASAGVDGSATANVQFVLPDHTNGRARIADLSPQFFDITGNVTADLVAYVEFITERKEERLASATLFDFSGSGGGGGGTPANRAPSFAKGPDQIVNVNSGFTTVNQWATQITPGPAGEESQLVEFEIINNSNPDLFLVAPTVAIDGTLTFLPKPNAIGAAVLILRAKDDGGTANGGVDTSSPQVFVITVKNDRQIIPTGVTTTTANFSQQNQLAPFERGIATDGVGNFVIAYPQITADPQYYDIYARLFNADGTEMGTPLLVAANQAGAYIWTSPSVAMNSKGDFAITWTALNEVEDEYNHVYVRSYAANGSPLSGVVRVDSLGGSAFYSNVAMDGLGGFVVAYDDGGIIAAQRFGSDGSKVGRAIIVHSDGDPYVGDQAVSVHSNALGDFVVSWYEPDLGVFDILAQAFDADGGKRGNVFSVTGFADGHEYQPYIALDADGDFIASWSDGNNTVFVQRFARDGTKLGSKITVNDPLNDWNTAYSSVAIDADGDFVVVWSASRPNENEAGIYLQAFQRDGTRRGSITRIAGNHEQLPRVSMDADGEFTVAWWNYFVSQNESQSIGIQRYRFDEPPTAVNLSNTVIEDLLPAGSIVGLLSTEDGGRPPQTFSYSFVTGAGSDDNSLFTLDPDGTIRTSAILDSAIKSNFLIRIQTTDSGGLTLQKQFTITIPKLNNFTLSNSSLPENQVSGTTIGTLSTTDSAGDSITYSLVNGNGSTDNSSFNIVDNTLRTEGSFDFETKNTYSIRVRATYSGVLTNDKTFTINVTNVNETPTGIAISNDSIVENAGENAIIGTFSTTDPDANDNFIYTLVTGTGSTDNSAFTITGNTLSANASFAFETKNSYTIRVLSTDQGNLFFEKQFTITIIDVNKSPTINTDPTLILPRIAINSKTHVGQPVSLLLANATDLETPNSLSVSITGHGGIAGVWERSTNATGPWTPINSASPGTPAVLAKTDFIRFTPGKNLTGYANVKFNVADGTNTSAESELAWVPVGVTPPKSDTQGRVILTGTKEDTLAPTASVASKAIGLLNSEFARNTRLGLAITATTGNGTWQVRVGTTWQAITGVSETTALLLKPTDSIRFVPAANWFGEATITYRSWQIPTGTNLPTLGNITTNPGDFSTEHLTAVVTVTSVNDAPTIDRSIARIFDTNPQTVATLLQGSSDVDGLAKGIAITRVSARNGVWQYRTSTAGTFIDLKSASATRGLLLDPNAEIRFMPTANATVSFGGFDYKVIDDSITFTSGTFKATTTTAFSSVVETGTFSTGNTSPTFKTGIDPKFPNTKLMLKPTVHMVSALLGRMTDTVGFLKGIAITGITGTGTWEFSLDAGKTWQAIGDVSTNRLLLRSTDRLRFTPMSVGTASLSFAAWDQTTGAAGDRLGTNDSQSTEILTASLLVA